MDLGTRERILLDEMSNVVCDSRPSVFVLSVIFGRGAFYVTGDHLFAVVLRERERLLPSPCWARTPIEPYRELCSGRNPVYPVLRSSYHFDLVHAYVYVVCVRMTLFLPKLTPTKDNNNLLL